LNNFILKQYFDILNKKFIITETDINGNIIYVNENFEKVSGYKKEEVLGKPHNIVRHPDMPKKVYEIMWKTIKSGKMWEGILKNKSKNGKDYFIKTVISPIFNEHGEIIKYTSFKQDITKLISIKNQLATEKTLLQKTLDNTNNIIIIRKNHKIIKANKQFFKTFGFSSIKDFLSKHTGLQDLFIKYFTPNYPEWDEKYNNNSIFVSMKDKTGKEKIFNMYISFFKLKKDKYSIITLNDITEIEKAKQKAEESKKLKSEFLANISHEMRNPLNSIIGYLELLKETNLNEEQKDFLNKIQFSADTLLEIINSILDFSKIESNKLQIANKDTNIYNLVISVYNTFKPLAKKKNIDLILDIDYKNVHECFIIDELRLKQVLINLLSNAIKFTDKGYVKIKVENNLTFRIIDTGIGIKEEKQKDIFKAYLQANEFISQKYGGTGLGLNISYNLVKLMGGELKVKSEEGKGSEFYFTINPQKCNTLLLRNKIKEINLKNEDLKEFFESLKIKISPTAPIIVEEKDMYEAYYKLYNLKEEKINQINFEGKKILIVEDYEINAALFNTILSKLGIDTKLVTNGEDAIKEAINNDYDLILMDITLPKLNGIEAAKKIKEKKEIPIIAVTGNTTKENINEYLKYMDDFLPKPVKKSILLEKLKKFLSPINISLSEKIARKFELSNEETEELIKTFKENTKKTLKELSSAIENKNFDEIYRHFHNLKSSLKYFDFDELSNIAEKYMNKAQNKEETNYKEALEKIKKGVKF
jgi:PAS domain S-box-containing protein